jgi:hypothetical protein
VTNGASEWRMESGQAGLTKDIRNSQRNKKNRESYALFI